MINTRVLAARIIDAVTEGRSLSDELATALPTIKEPRDRAFVQALCYGVCRFYTRLDYVLSQLLQKPMKAKDSDVHALLLVGLLQLMEMHTPDYAAVTETVNATKTLNKPWARGLVNAVLREFIRQRTTLEQQLQTDLEAHYAHPRRWIDGIKAAWPLHFETILAANNAHPPFSLRVNQQCLTRALYLEKLSEQQTAQIIPETQQGIVLTTSVPVEQLPGFNEGMITVQDGAAQLAAELLELAPKQTILDACAAPGVKLTHILEMAPELAKLIAVEKDATRIGSIKENLQRMGSLGQKTTVICQDVSEVTAWHQGELFDRILLDAPCSASGVIRRHPDIKLLRQPNDLAALAKQQTKLLNALWPLLKPNGILLYATCSVFPMENVLVMERFLAEHPDAQEKIIEATWGQACTVGRQILPGMHNLDGFYYARVRKMEKI